MPGRFTLTTDAAALRAAFPWLQVPEQLAPRYNIAPSNPVAVVTNAAPTQLDFMTWGLFPSPETGVRMTKPLINARSETITRTASFRNSFRRRRCLVLADGVFEWVKERGKRQKTPYYIYLKDHRPFAYAGVWESWTSLDGSQVVSCAIITCEPNEMVEKIHHRMGVILHEEDYEQWLATDEKDARRLLPLLGPYPAEDMASHQVSTLVTDKRNDTPECIKAVEGISK